MVIFIGMNKSQPDPHSRSDVYILYSVNLSDCYPLSPLFQVIAVQEAWKTLLCNMYYMNGALGSFLLHFHD